MLRPSFVLFLLVAACGGVASNPDAFPRADASTDAPDASPPPKPAEAADAGRDATADPEGALPPTHPCSDGSSHAFCADFDGPTLGAGWTFADHGTEIAASASDRSAPFAASFAGHPLPAGTTPTSAWLEKVLDAASTTKLTTSFDLRVGAVGIDRGNTIADTSIVKSTADSMSFPFDAQLAIGAARAELIVIAESPDGPSPDTLTTVDTAPLARGRWVHVVFTLVAPGDGTGTVDLTYDGAPAAHVAVKSLVTGLGGATVGIGRPLSTTPGLDTVVAFDNVVVDYQ